MASFESKVLIRDFPPLTLNYERRGSGSPLVLLHGIGHHWQAWEPVLDRLAEQHDVIAVDFPGFGKSSPIPPVTEQHVDVLVEGITAFFADLGIDRPHVAGNSMGGFVSLVLAQRGLVRSVTALSPAGLWNGPERTYSFLVLRACRLGALRMSPALVARLAGSRFGRSLLVGMIYGRPGLRRPQDVTAEVRALREATGFESTLSAATADIAIRDDVPDIPVTIAWGSRDRILPTRQGVRAKHLIPNATLIRLPGCGHVPMSDDPDLVARVILQGATDQAKVA